MPVKFEKTNKPIGLVEIHELEEELEMKLPEEYKQFLLLINGGILASNTLLPYHDELWGDTYDLIHEICGIHTEKTSYRFSIKELYKRMYSEDEHENRMLPDCIPIARGGTGHEFYGISIAPEKFGKIYLWYDDNLPFYEEAILIADSFNEFLDLIGSSTLNYDDDGKLIE